MISLAGRDILHSWTKYVYTGIGLGLLIGVTLSMAGIYRGMVDDAQALLKNSGADIWVVQKDTLGPYAEPSSVRDDAYRAILGLSGIAQAANVTYLTMQVQQAEQNARDVRVMVVGFEPDQPGQPLYLSQGRFITRSHYEAIADVKTGFTLGDRIKIRRHAYTVVGLTRRMVGKCRNTAPWVRPIALAIAMVVMSAGLCCAASVSKICTISAWRASEDRRDFWRSEVSILALSK